MMDTEVSTVNEYLTAACFLIISFLLLFPHYKVKEKYPRQLFLLKAEQTYLFLLLSIIFNFKFLTDF